MNLICDSVLKAAVRRRSALSGVGIASVSVRERAVVSSRIRSEFGRLGERVRRRPTHCFVDELHPGIVLSWTSCSAGWVALVATGTRVAGFTSDQLRPLGSGTTVASQVLDADGSISSPTATAGSTHPQSVARSSD